MTKALATGRVSIRTPRRIDTPPENPSISSPGISRRKRTARTSSEIPCDAAMQALRAGASGAQRTVAWLPFEAVSE